MLGHDARPGHRQPRTRNQQSDHCQQKPGAVRLDLSAGRARRSDAGEIRELAHTRDERDEPPHARLGTADPAPDAEWRDLHAPEREHRNRRGRDRDSNPDDEDVDRAQRQVGREEGLSRERHLRHRRPEHQEQNEAADDADHGRDERLDRRDERHLPGRRADEPHRRVPLFPLRGRQTGRRRDEEQHGKQQREGHHREDQLDPTRVRAKRRRALWRGLDAAHLGHARGMREFVDGAPNDNRQRSRRRQRRVADCADLLARVAVAELIGGRRMQQTGERGRGVILPGPRQTRDTRRYRRAGTGRGDIDSVDLRRTELVERDHPPQRIRLGLVDARANVVRGGEQPRAADVLGVKGVRTSQRDEEQRDAQRNRGGGNRESHHGFPPVRQTEAEAEPDHDTMRSAEVTRPSRTMISRSAYAATRASWVTKMTVVPSERGVGEQVHDLLSRERIERARGLVHEEHLRVRHHAAGQGDALGLTAGQTPRSSLLEPAEFEPVEPRPRLPRRLQCGGCRRARAGARRSPRPSARVRAGRTGTRSRTDHAANRCGRSPRACRRRASANQISP